MPSWSYTVGDGYYYNHYQLTGNAQIIKDFYTAKGFSDAAIIGIIANMEHESYLNPGQQEHGYSGSVTRGYGLVQWTPASSKILAYANRVQGNWYDGDIQLDYSLKSFPDAWAPRRGYNITFADYKNLTDIYYATAAFFWCFEYGTWTDDLYDYAYNWYDILYSGQPIPPQPAPTPVPPTPPHHDSGDDWYLQIMTVFLSKMLR